MSEIEEEKRTFKRLFEMKPNLSIDLKDYTLQNQVQLMEEEANRNTRAGGLPIKQDTVTNGSALTSDPTIKAGLARMNLQI